MARSNTIQLVITAVDQTSAVLNKLGDRFRDVGQQLTTGLSLPLGGLAALSAKAAIDFESSFAGVRKTVNATEAQFAELSAGVRQLARTIPAGTTEINNVAEAAGQLGIETANLLQFTETMVHLGNTTNLSAQEAATALARLANITQMPQENFDRLGATIVALGNKLATTEAEITEMGLRIAGAGSQVGLTEAQILALGGALSSVGIAADAGGTAISRVLVTLAQVTAKGGPDLVKFASIAGQTGEEFKKAFKEDAAGALITFIEGLGEMSASGQNVFGVLDELALGEIRVRDALLRASGAGDLFRKSLELGSAAWAENTALTDEASKRYETTASKLAIFKNTLYDAAITLGDSLLPALTSAVEAAKPLISAVSALARGFGELPQWVQTVVIVLGALAVAAGPVIYVVGSIMATISTLITVATALAGVLAPLAPLFAALTGPIGLVIAAVAALATGAYLLYTNWELVKMSIKALGDGIKTWLTDKLSAATAAVSDTTKKIKDSFQWLFDVVVGHSIVPDMVDGVIAEFGRMDTEVQGVWERWFGSWQSTLEAMQNISRGVWQDFRKGVGEAVGQAIVYGESLAGAFSGIMQKIAASLISALVQMGVERVAQWILGQLLLAKESTSRMAVLSAETFAGAFAATAAIPIVGPALAPGVAAASTAAMLAGAAGASAVGAAFGAGVVGVAHGGLDNVPAESTYLLDKGERVLSPRQNRDLTDFMSRDRGNSGGVVIKELNIMPGASIDEALFNKPPEWWLSLAKKKILPALNVLGDVGATTSLRYSGGRI